MKLFKGVVAAILFSSGDASLSIYDNFLELTELEFYKSIPVSENNKGSCKGADRIFGHVNFNKDMRSRIQDANEKNSSISEHVEELEVRTSFIHRTTDGHVDRVNGVGHEHVSFVFLNSNDDAYFIHGDTEVPVVAGSMVTFSGDVYHHTRVNSGHIHLLGPFDAHTYEPIGCGIVIDCCGTEVNRADTCLAACGNPENGVTCNDEEVCTCNPAGTDCFNGAESANVDGNPFDCCGESVNDLESCVDACINAVGEPNVGELKCTANPDDCETNWLNPFAFFDNIKCLKENKEEGNTGTTRI